MRRFSWAYASIPVVVAALIIALSFASVGIGSAASNKPAPLPPSSSASASAKPKPTPTPVKPPTFFPDGTAAQNLPYFTYQINQALAQPDVVDSYGVAVFVSQQGFDPSTIQFTFSSTAVGLLADSSDVAALWGDQCLIAQFGKEFPTPHVVILPMLAQGGCLIGAQVQPLG